jgi:hypothetical protein
VVWGPPFSTHAWPITVSGGLVYFGFCDFHDSEAPCLVASVPAAPTPGGAAVEPHVYARLSIRDAWSTPGAVLDGPCFYEAARDSRVIRIDLRDGNVRVLFERKQDGALKWAWSDVPPWDASLATDERSLYWADYHGDRIVRWSR